MSNVVTLHSLPRSSASPALVLPLRDLLSEQIEEWIEEAEQIAADITRAGTYGSIERQKIFEHIRRLREEILSNPLHPGLDLRHPVIDNHNHVWELGDESSYPSLLHYAFVHARLFPGTPLVVPGTTDPITEIRVHEFAQHMLTASSRFQEPGRLLAQPAADDAASLQQFFTAYVANAALALRTARDEEFAIRLRALDQKFDTLQQQYQEEIELVVESARLSQERHNARAAVAQEITRSTWETRFDTLEFRINVSEDQLKSTQENLQSAKEKCQQLKEQNASLASRCSALEQQLHDLGQRLNHSGSSDCSVM